MGLNLRHWKPLFDCSIRNPFQDLATALVNSIGMLENQEAWSFSTRT